MFYDGRGVLLQEGTRRHRSSISWCEPRPEGQERTRGVEELTRELKIITLLILVVVLAAAAGKVAGSQAQPLEIWQVKNGLYVITGSGGNVAARVTTEGVILVDDKFERNHAEIMQRVRSVTDRPITYVLGTHHHGDHVGGNLLMSRHAQIISHRNVRVNMVRNDHLAPPKIIFSDRAAIFLGGVEVRAHHLGRGHTNGDAVIIFPDLRTIHTGDLFVESTPFIDYDNGGNGKKWIDTLDRILALDFDTVIPGHGPVMKRGDVKIFRDRFVTLRTRMSQLIRQGVAKDDVVNQLQTDDINWPLNPEGLFVRRSLPDFYDEIQEGM